MGVCPVTCELSCDLLLLVLCFKTNRKYENLFKPQPNKHYFTAGTASVDSTRAILYSTTMAHPPPLQPPRAAANHLLGRSSFSLYIVSKRNINTAERG